MASDQPVLTGWVKRIHDLHRQKSRQAQPVRLGFRRIRVCTGMPEIVRFDRPPPRHGYTAGVLVPRSKHRAGRPWRRAKAQMHATYGYTCHICGHGGAYEADHLTPLAVEPGQPVDYHHMRPAHGSSSPCMQCPRTARGKPRCCNQERGARPVGVVQAFVPVHAW